MGRHKHCLFDRLSTRVGKILFVVFCLLDCLADFFFYLRLMLFLFFLGMMGLVLTGRAIAVEVRGEYALRTAVTTVMCFLMAMILMILNLLR